MSLTVANNKNICLLSAIAVIILITLQYTFSQPLKKRSGDSVATMVNDTLLPTLVMKVASYTSTIDHTDFLIRRKFNITPISLDLPEIERKVKGFKTRPETNGSQMNLRSLNSGIIMLDQISGRLSSYQGILLKYSSELTNSNVEIKKILRDPILNVQLSDSVLLEQLQDIRIEGHALDSLQQVTLNKVNLLRNRVSINLLQATDIISDMRYLTITRKMGMWKQEEPPLFDAHEKDYRNRFDEVIRTALQRSWLIISIYMDERWNVLTIGLLVLISIFSWSLLNMFRIKKQENVGAVLLPMHFLPRNVLVGCLMVFFTYMPFFFGNPPMSLMHACELLRLLTLTFLIYPFLTKQSKILWITLCILWTYYAIDDILLESALGERWGLFIAGILLTAICIKILTHKQSNFIDLPESPATKALVIFTLTQVALSVIFNFAGRASLAKILGVSGVQCLILGITLKVFSGMVLEAIYLQSEAYQDSRFSQFINYKSLQHRFIRVLWILSILIFTLSLIRNLTLYDVVTDALASFISETRTIGSMVFTFKSVGIFICILWFSSVLSGFINFFFGNGKLQDSNKRSRIGSMMLLIRLAIWTLGFCIAVAAAGIPLDRISLMLGALGVGIGFGLQNIVNNLVSGVIIAFERPIQVGDLIEVGGKTGVVKEIGVRSSKINNNAGADIIVPNGDLLSQHLINWTMQDRSKQVEFSIGIPYDADIKKVTTSIQETLVKNERIMKTPGPAILVQKFGDLAIDLKILFWVDDLNEAGGIRSAAMIEIYQILESIGIKLPVSNGPLLESLLKFTITPCV
ncbi:MAG: mechanosensitive ion channel [Bacteroidota bacterium]|nr:mechanosensitive ion channel [Bacteroidota bacterium]